MCHFITLVVRGSDRSSIASVVERHGRRAKPAHNASVASALTSDEAQYLTTVSYCDCGTALGPTLAPSANRNTEQVAKLEKKGWSRTKIKRWLSDREKADARAREHSDIARPDSIDLWSDIVGDLVAMPGVDQAGLLLHFYSGDVDQEQIALTRNTVGIEEFSIRLRDIQEDELLMAVSV